METRSVIDFTISRDADRFRRVILVGTTTYHHYKHDEVETEAIVTLTRDSGGWLGYVMGQISIATGISHSGRDQGEFHRLRVELPRVIEVGKTYTFRTDDFSYLVEVASITIS